MSKRFPTIDDTTGRFGRGPAREYSIKRLRGADVLRAYPLARLAAGHLTLAAWLRFAQALGTEPARGKRPALPAFDKGLLAVEDARGLIQALCSFEVHPDLRSGRRLVVDNIVAIDLLDSAEPATALVRAIEKLAHELDCPAFAVHPPPAAHAARASRVFLDALLGENRTGDQAAIYRSLPALL
jgi:hypothetical protein